MNPKKNKKELNDRTIQLSFQVKDVKRSLGSNANKHENSPNSQLEEDIGPAFPQATNTTILPSRSMLTKHHSISNLHNSGLLLQSHTSREAARSHDTLVADPNSNDVTTKEPTKRHRKHQSFDTDNASSEIKKAWR
jgi:hypothetical protein